MARFQVAFAKSAQIEVDRIRVFERRRIVDAIASNLFEQPGIPSRNRKRLGDGITADFEYVPPLWELRVGDYRVVYDINEADLIVRICAVRHKPPGKTTAEVLNEKNDR